MPSNMYRVVIFLLSVLSLTLLALIVSVTLWRDYELHGGVSLVRALQGVLPKADQSAGLSLESAVGDEVALGHGRSTVPPELLPLVQSEFLYLINSERVRSQVNPLTMGVNSSAQLHAESMMTHGYRSHWDVNGLTSQMRYTLAGGANRMMENIAGPVEAWGSGSRKEESWRELVARVHQEFMQDREGRVNTLEPWHRKVTVGFACDQANCWVVQQFESDAIIFSEAPAIRGGSLSIEGKMEPGFDLDGLLVWFHPHPRQLGLGQLDATYHYGAGGIPATFLRADSPPDRYYPYSLVSYHWDGGIDPYSLDPGLARSGAPPLKVEVAHSAAVPWTTASRWEQDGQAFAVEADLSPIIRGHGPGVYTVQTWARWDEERVPLTNYTIFVK